ncbi:hypothetical protein GQR58_001736 [Nymphon striatum]|nr:hypothetical protein GQR58_001736 [Nymphon striatum]
MLFYSYCLIGWLSSLAEDKMSGGISITKLNIPRYVYIKQNVTLNCHFDLNGSRLYSVKWYKDNTEIYRFIPSHKPEVKIYHTKGVVLDRFKSKPGSIVILEAVEDTSGTYACEISGEEARLPNKIHRERNDYSCDSNAFQSNFSIHKKVPQEKPLITGIRTNYQVGDTVSVNCTSLASIYKTKLTWYVNDRMVRWDLADEEEIQWYKNGSQKMSLGLNFVIDFHNSDGGHLEFPHFMGVNGKNVLGPISEIILYVMIIKCAHFGAFTTKATIISHIRQTIM